MHKFYLDLLFSLEIDSRILKKDLSKYSNIFGFLRIYKRIFSCPKIYKLISEYILTEEMAQIRIRILFEGHFIGIFKCSNICAHHCVL